MGEREVDRLDTVLVLLGVRVLVAAAHRVARLQLQFLFERLDEGLEHIQHQRVRALDDLVRRTVDERRKHDRPAAVLLDRLVDFFERRVGLLGRIDEGDPNQAKFLVELGEDRMREGFGSDPGTVGDDEYGGRHQWGREREREITLESNIVASTPTVRWLTGDYRGVGAARRGRRSRTPDSLGLAMSPTAGPGRGSRRNSRPTVTF